MRTLAVVVFFLFPFVALAQNSQAQSGDIQKLMQEMQQCMAQVDQAELEKLEKEGEKFENEVKALCKQGKRDKAQKMAIKYSKEAMENPALVQMNKCAEISKKMMPAGVVPEEDDEEEFDPSKDHICDNLE